MFEVLKIFLWSVWILLMWASLMAVTKTAVLQGLQQILNFYFDRRLKWLEEMETKFGLTEKEVGSRVRNRSSFN